MQSRRILFFALCTCLLIAAPVHAEDSIELAGDVLQFVLPAAAYGMTFGFQDPEGRIQYTKSLALSTAVTWGLKLSVDRERPNGGSYSMPSGHASVAFSGASFIQRRYGWEYGIPAYMAATFVAFSRVHSDDHFVEDVAVGAFIGIISTYLFTDPYERGLHVVPLVGNGTYGVLFTTQW